MVRIDYYEFAMVLYCLHVSCINYSLIENQINEKNYNKEIVSIVRVERMAIYS